MSATSLYLLSIFSLAQSAVITRWSELSIGQLGFWRLCIAAVVLRLIFSIKTFWYLPRKPKVILYIVLSGLGLYLHFFCYFFAAKNTTVANTLILFSLNPLFTGLLSRWMIKEAFPPSVAGSFVFGLLSVMTLVYPIISIDKTMNWGDMAALFSGLTYSLYILAAKKAQTMEDSNQVISWSFMVAAIAFLLQMIVGAEPVGVASQNGVISLALLIIFPTLLGHAVFLFLTKKLNINWMSVGKLAEPPIATLVAFMVLGQVPQWYVYVAFMFLGLAMLFLFQGSLKRLFRL
jgi:drug/metabolite transporter, DME family